MEPLRLVSPTPSDPEAAVGAVTEWGGAGGRRGCRRAALWRSQGSRVCRAVTYVKNQIPGFKKSVVTYMGTTTTKLMIAFKERKWHKEKHPRKKKI